MKMSGCKDVRERGKRSYYCRSVKQWVHNYFVFMDTKCSIRRWDKQFVLKKKTCYHTEFDSLYHMKMVRASLILYVWTTQADLQQFPCSNDLLDTHDCTHALLSP